MCTELMGTKTAFLIFGAQRSGTSVTSHMLSKFGVNFGAEQNFLQDNHNPIFFELKWVNQFNDRLIRQLGYQYTDFFLPIEADFAQADVQEVATQLPALIQQEWQDENRIGIKDPRFSLTFPIWEDALQDAGYSIKIIFVFRNPSGFLRSNQKLLNGWEGWNKPRHFQFWLQSNLAGIYFARNYPIHFVSYDNLMSQPLEVAHQIAEQFQLDGDRISIAASVVNCDHHHHKQSTETDDPLINHYYRLLCEHQLSANDYLDYRNQISSEQLHTEASFSSVLHP